MAMIDDQFERCKAAVVRLEDLVPENARRDDTVPIAIHEVDDLDVFLQNARHAINVMRNLSELRNEAEIKLAKAEAVLARHPEALAEYRQSIERGSRWLVDEVSRGHVIDKSVARRYVVTGHVQVNNVKVDDPAALVAVGDLIELLPDSALRSSWRVS